MRHKRTLWRLDSSLPCPWAPNVSEIAATHVKFVHLSYEAVRDEPVQEGHRSSPEGYLYALFAHACRIDGVWVEIRDWAGIEMRLDVSGVENLCRVNFSRNPRCWHEIDLVLLDKANDLGLLPPGKLVTEDNIEIAFAPMELLAKT